LIKRNAPSRPAPPRPAPPRREAAPPQAAGTVYGSGPYIWIRDRFQALLKAAASPGERAQLQAAYLRVRERAAATPVSEAACHDAVLDALNQIAAVVGEER
jgi:hypothetical protein